MFAVIKTIFKDRNGTFCVFMFFFEFGDHLAEEERAGCLTLNVCVLCHSSFVVFHCGIVAFPGYMRIQMVGEKSQIYRISY